MTLWRGSRGDGGTSSEDSEVGSRRALSSAYPGGRHERVLVVGSGTRFLSGVSYYTIRLANALATKYEVAAVPMRQLLPTLLYPGRARVGAPLTRFDYEPGVRVLGPVDWYWLPTLLVVLVRMISWRPDVIVFQWWTGTVLHTYLALATIGRLLGAAVVIEFHEVLDTGEDRIPLARAYANIVGRALVRLADGWVVHSTADREPLLRRYRPGRRANAVIPHGPYDYLVIPGEDPAHVRSGRREAPPECTNILFFGVIRPFKGLEDLLAAFEALSEEEIGGYWLTVVGETWEGWDRPIREIASSRYRSRITLVNRYVDDAEEAAHLAAADAVVLPYHRSSASGPAHLAMSWGLPLVVTAVGGLPAAVDAYEGAILVQPHDPDGLRDALRRLPALKGRHFRDPHSWERTVERYGELFSRVRPERATA